MEGPLVFGLLGIVRLSGFGKFEKNLNFRRLKFKFEFVLYTLEDCILSTRRPKCRVSVLFSCICKKNGVPRSFSRRFSDSTCLSIIVDDVLMICHAHTRHLWEFDINERSRSKSKTWYYSLVDKYTIQQASKTVYNPSERPCFIVYNPNSTPVGL